MNHGTLYYTSDDFQLVCYRDSDIAANTEYRRSTSSYPFNLGTCVVAWASKKQPIVTLSSVEAEYVVGTEKTCQAVSMQRISKDLMQTQDRPTTIYCDNKSAIAISKNHVFHKRTKHNYTRYHFIRELVNNRQINLQHCRSEEQLADIFTKALAQEQFEILREALGIVNIHDVDSRNQGGVLEILISTPKIYVMISVIRCFGILFLGLGLGCICCSSLKNSIDNCLVRKC